jgi:hypothetical protein
MIKKLNTQGMGEADEDDVTSPFADQGITSFWNYPVATTYPSRAKERTDDRMEL